MGICIKAVMFVGVCVYACIEAQMRGEDTGYEGCQQFSNLKMGKSLPPFSLKGIWRAQKKKIQAAFLIFGFPNMSPPLLTVVVVDKNCISL